MMDVENIARLRELVGQEIGVSDWFVVTQDRINQFADATGDHQWIHIDQERAGRESPYSTTIAHGFLTLALVSALLRSALSIGGLRIAINYGLNRVRFVSAVPVNSRIRARVTPMSMEDVDNGVQVVWKIVVEREGGEKPALAAEWLVRYYPDAVG